MIGLCSALSPLQIVLRFGHHLEAFMIPHHLFMGTPMIICSVQTFSEHSNVFDSELGEFTISESNPVSWDNDSLMNSQNRKSLYSLLSPSPYMDLCDEQSFESQLN